MSYKILLTNKRSLCIPINCSTLVNIIFPHNMYLAPVNNECIQIVSWDAYKNCNPA